MKHILTIASLMLALLTFATAAPSKESADLRAVAAVPFFKGKGDTALLAAANRLENGTEIPAGQVETLREIRKTAAENMTKAPAGTKLRTDAEDLVKALDAVLGSGPATTAPTTPAVKRGTVVPPAKRQSGGLTKPTVVEWDDEDPEAPQINAPSEAHLRFSAKLALLDAGMTDVEIKTAGGIKQAAIALMDKSGTTKPVQDMAMYALAATNGAEYLKGGMVPSDMELVTLEECDGQVRASGKGSERKQKIIVSKVKEAIVAVLTKADGGTPSVTVASSAPPVATSPTPTVPATPATATPVPAPAVGGGIESLPPADPASAPPAATPAPALKATPVPEVVPARVPAKRFSPPPARKDFKATPAFVPAGAVK